MLLSIYIFLTRYTCYVTSVFSIVPPPQVTIAHSQQSAAYLYEETTLNITCSAELVDFFGTPVLITFLWTGPNGQQLTSNKRISIQPSFIVRELVYVSQVVFDPIEQRDSGSYECQVITVSRENSTINSSNSSSIELAVRGWSTIKIYLLLSLLLELLGGGVVNCNFS